MTIQLTALTVKFSEQLHTAVTLQHLSALQPLGSCLQSLKIKTATVDPAAVQQRQQQYSFLQGLTCLTSLSVPVASEDLEEGISSSIAGLTKLAVMCLDSWSVNGGLAGGAAGGMQLGHGFSSALAHLTALTIFEVSWALVMQCAGVCCMREECVHVMSLFRPHACGAGAWHYLTGLGKGGSSCCMWCSSK
jgi:hypothetical protein